MADIYLYPTAEGTDVTLRSTSEVPTTPPVGVVVGIVEAPDTCVASISSQSAFDDEPPILTGSLSVTGVTSDSLTLSCDVATDNVAVGGYEISVDTGTPSFLTIGGTPNYTVAGLLPDTLYTIRIRAFDPTGNKSNILTSTARTLDQVIEPILTETNKTSNSSTNVITSVLTTTELTVPYKTFLAQELVLYNKSANTVTVTLEGDKAVMHLVPKTAGTSLDLTGGLVVSVPANSFAMILLNKGRLFLQGTVTIKASVSGVVSAALVR